MSKDVLLQNMLCKDRIIEKMNILGKERKPFLFIVDFEKENGYVVEDPFNQQDVLFQLNSISNSFCQVNDLVFAGLMAEPKSSEEYNCQFGVVREGLQRGDSFLANLTIKTKVDINISLEDVFQMANSKYKLLVRDKFVCFSPECFVRIENNRISTFPMKGTIDCSIENAKDVILNDYKETCEHNTIVDLMRNDLNIIASNVRVERFRYIDELKTSRGNILQVSSEISGDLDYDYYSELGNLIFNLLPAGSVSGAPKASTLKIIQDAEKEKRGFYTGVFGLFDGLNLDSAVIIRYIENKDDKYYFRSGGGVTINSKSKDEYQEAINKIYLPF
ncbi:MAG: aminodeoxychorismate synthase component I [Bacteroidales bacterium]|nr:aminodeoxychorismate synthase component I [Bacteroidales bacterium]